MAVFSPLKLSRVPLVEYDLFLFSAHNEFYPFKLKFKNRMAYSIEPHAIAEPHVFDFGPLKPFFT